MKSTVREKLESYYQQRADRLSSLKLEDVLPHDSVAFWSPISASAPEVVMRLIEHHLASFEAEWRREIRNANFCLQAIHSRKQVDEQLNYETELADAHNRLTLAFINGFCKPNYSIDWERLLQPSGKD